MKGNTFVTMFVLLASSVLLLMSGCGSSSSSDSPPPDVTVPTAPTFVTAVAASDTRVSVNWTASEDNIGVASYTIYRNGGEIATTATATTFYSNINCTTGTPYTYTVTAKDAAGNDSLPSSSASATTLGPGLVDGQSPGPPVALTVTASSSTQIALEWVAPSDNVAVSGYTIYRAAASLGPYAKIGTATTTVYTDSGLTAGTEYYYVVKAFDGFPNESGASNETSALAQ
jgi:fibronectin type 3 domain-containing protein